MNRFDIAQAHAVLEWDYNVDGWLRERPSNQRRMEATAVQLNRMKFKPNFDLSLATLSEDGKEVYMTNVLRWNLPMDGHLQESIQTLFTPEFIAEFNHPAFAAATTERPGS